MTMTPRYCLASQAFRGHTFALQFANLQGNLMPRQRQIVIRIPLRAGEIRNASRGSEQTPLPSKSCIHRPRSKGRDSLLSSCVVVKLRDGTTHVILTESRVCRRVERDQNLRLLKSIGLV